MADHLESRGAIVVGDGKFGVHAVGTSAYQGPIENLVGGKTPMGYGVEPGLERAFFGALLLPDPDDFYDKNAIRCILAGESGATRTPFPAQGGQQSGDCGQQVMAA